MHIFNCGNTLVLTGWFWFWYPDKYHVFINPIMLQAGKQSSHWTWFKSDNSCCFFYISLRVQQVSLTVRGGWGCEVSFGGHHRPRGKTTTGSALDGAVFDIAQILAYLVHNMSRSQLYLGFGHFGWLDPFFFLFLWLNCISSVEITLFLLADILPDYCSIGLCFSVRV